jgi:hypothetical protein
VNTVLKGDDDDNNNNNTSLHTDMTWVAQHSEAMAWMTTEFGFHYQQGYADSSLCHYVKTGLQSNPTSFQRILGILSHWVKQPWCKTNHSPLSGKEGQKTLEPYFQTRKMLTAG